MAENYLITGYWGEPHVTAENDRGIHAGIFGAGRYVLPVGEQFRAEYIGNNTVRIYDGKLIDNGAAAGIPAGEYVDLQIPYSSQGTTRNDLIVFQYSQDASTLIESGTFVVINGEESAETATDPALTQHDLLSGTATLDQMALWRVTASSTEIGTPVKLFSIAKNLNTAGGVVVEATSTNGVDYVATVDGIDRLYSGMELIIIPNIDSTSTAITLNVNGMGAKTVRLPLSTNTAIMVQPVQNSFFVANRPVKLMFDAAYLSGKGVWKVSGQHRTSASDLYGSVPIENGGHGADNAEEGMRNLLAAGAVILSEKQYGSELPPTGVKGQLFVFVM